MSTVLKYKHLTAQSSLKNMTSDGLGVRNVIIRTSMQGREKLKAQWMNMQRC